ncbi:hypothetical protein BC832DRAFT_480634 [Gaertneriomyces semiglobifer]|nr:hypothetical protein BC832DRAFT_480634 [Gaertneriomyces semiglobifer]
MVTSFYKKKSMATRRQQAADEQEGTPSCSVERRQNIHHGFSPREIGSDRLFQCCFCKSRHSPRWPCALQIRWPTATCEIWLIAPGSFHNCLRSSYVMHTFSPARRHNSCSACTRPEYSFVSPSTHAPELLRTRTRTKSRVPRRSGTGAHGGMISEVRK